MNGPGWFHMFHIHCESFRFMFEIWSCRELIERNHEKIVETFVMGMGDQITEKLFELIIHTAIVNV